MDFYQIISENPNNLRDLRIALIGGGGKTELMRKIGLELAAYFPKVLLASVTESELSRDENLVLFNEIYKNDFTRKFQNKGNPIFLMKSWKNDEKLIGVSETELSQVYPSANITLFECDGAKKMPLKIHTDFDPEVPRFATHVIVIIGADVVNTRMIDNKIHRPRLFKQIWGIADDFGLNYSFIADVVTTKKGYLGKINHNPTVIYFVNKADKYPKNAKQLAEEILRKSKQPTFYGSVQAGFWKQIS